MIAFIRHIVDTESRLAAAGITVNGFRTFFVVIKTVWNQVEEMITQHRERIKGQENYYSKILLYPSKETYDETSAF